MINNILLLLAFILATFHYFIKRKQFNSSQIVDLYLIYFLFFGVGIIASIGFISHLFFPNQTAELIGWPTGSPFQFEVGFHDGAWGLLGILCLFIRDKFWLATGIGWSFFMLGAAYGHVIQATHYENFAPYNAGTIAPDILVPVILLGLLFLKYVYFKNKE